MALSAVAVQGSAPASADTGSSDTVNTRIVKSETFTARAGAAGSAKAAEEFFCQINWAVSWTAGDPTDVTHSTTAWCDPAKAPRIGGEVDSLLIDEDDNLLSMGTATMNPVDPTPTVATATESVARPQTLHVRSELSLTILDPGEVWKVAPEGCTGISSIYLQCSLDWADFSV